MSRRSIVFSNSRAEQRGYRMDASTSRSSADTALWEAYSRHDKVAVTELLHHYFMETKAPHIRWLEARSTF
jgi:hypothetical protein